MNYRLAIILLCYLATQVLRAQLPPAIIGENYVVGGTVLNIRSGPGTQYEIIGKLEPGNTVELVRAEGSWWVISVGEEEGFVAAKYLRRDDLSGWTRKQYNTGETPECENVSPQFDRSIDNMLRVKVGSNTDVVVKLMRMGSYGDECIRIIYARAGDTYEMKNIPEGKYYLKLAYGKDYRQRVENGYCKVRFAKNALYKKGKDILDFNKRYYAGGWEEPSYELILNVITTFSPHDEFRSGGISEEEFNK